MNIEEFSHRIIELLPQASRGFARYEHDYLKTGEITLPQFWALNYLYSNKKAKMGELARYLNITRPAITGLVDRLIIQELVDRKDDESDRRIVWIELTEKGRDIIHSIRGKKVKILTQVFSKVSYNDRGRYIDILEQVVRIVNSLPQPAIQKQTKDKRTHK